MKRLNPAARSLILICAFLLTMNVLLGFVLIRNSQHAIREQIESRMLDVSNTAAAMLDGDILRTLQAEDVNTPEYRAIHNTLFRFEQNIELAYIYCVRALDDGSFVFTIDPDPESPGAFGDHIPYTEALYNASLGTPGVDKEAYVDQWGRFYSAYSPVFDSNGNVTDIVAVDFTADWYDRQFSSQLKAIVSISGISILVASISILLIANRYKKRFDRLFQGMNNVSEGIETLVHEISPDAEYVEQTVKSTPNADEIDMMNERISSLQEKLSKQIQLVRSRAYIDGLTGLNNRAAYEEHVRRLEDEISGATADFAIALFDVNSLKEVNDKYGHKKGDEVIRSAAFALQRTFREGKLYRIGGDEFVAILEGGYAELPEKLAALRENQGGFSISAGSAVYDRGTDREYRSVFNRADTAMYNDKREYYLTHADRRHAPLNGHDELGEDINGEHSTSAEKT